MIEVNGKHLTVAKNLYMQSSFIFRNSSAMEDGRMEQYPESTTKRIGLSFFENQAWIQSGPCASNSLLDLMFVSSHHFLGLYTRRLDLFPRKKRATATDPKVSTANRNSQGICCRMSVQKSIRQRPRLSMTAPISIANDGWSRQLRQEGILQRRIMSERSDTCDLCLPKSTGFHIH